MQKIILVGYNITIYDCSLFFTLILIPSYVYLFVQDQPTLTAEISLLLLNLNFPSSIRNADDTLIYKLILKKRAVENVNEEVSSLDDAHSIQILYGLTRHLDERSS